MKRECFRCGKKLKSLGKGFQSPPDNATAWQTPGNYGSTVFDSPTDMLEIYICDPCLKENAAKAYRFVPTIRHEISEIEIFDTTEHCKSVKGLSKLGKKLYDVFNKNPLKKKKP